MANGIIIDVGFKADVNSFINTLESQFKKIDYGKYIGLSEAFESQEKEIKAKIQELKDLLANDWGRGEISKVNEQMKEMQGAISGLSKSIATLVKMAPPDLTSELSKQLSGVSSEANDFTKATDRIVQAIKDVDNASKSSGSGTQGARKQVEALMKEYKELQKIIDGIDNRNEKKVNKEGNSKYSASDKDALELLDKMQKKYEEFAYIREKYDKVDESAANYQELSVSLAKVSDELNRLINTYSKLNFDLGETIDFEDDKEIRDVYITELIDAVDFAFEDVTEAIKAKYLELGNEIEKLSNQNLEEIFSKSTASSDKVKLTIPLEVSTTEPQLTDQAIKIIEAARTSLKSQPLQIEVQLISDFGKYDNTKAMNKLSSLLPNIDDSKVKQEVENLITKLNTRLDSALELNVHIASENATKQVKDFVGQMKSEMKQISDSLYIRPKVEISDEAKEELQDQVNTLISEGLTLNIVGDSNEKLSKKQTGYFATLEKKLGTINTLVDQISAGYSTQADMAYDAATRVSDSLKLISDPLHGIDVALQNIIVLYKEFGSLNGNSKKSAQEGMSQAVQVLLVQTKNALGMIESAITNSIQADTIALDPLKKKFEEIQKLVKEVSDLMIHMPKDIQLGVNNVNIDNSETIEAIEKANKAISVAMANKAGNSITIPADDKRKLISDIRDISDAIDSTLSTNPIETWSNKFIGELDKISTKLQSLFGNNELYNTLKAWTDSDKRNRETYEGLSALVERSSVLGSNGKMYGKFDTGEHGSTRMIYSAVKEAIEDGASAVLGVHTHPENVSAMSLSQIKKGESTYSGDLIAFYQQYKEEAFGNIEKQLIRSLKETEVFDAKGFFDSNEGIDFSDANIQKLISDKAEEYRKKISKEFSLNIIDMFDDSQIENFFNTLNRNTQNSDVNSYIRNALSGSSYNYRELWNKIKTTLLHGDTNFSGAIYSVIASYTEGLDGAALVKEIPKGPNPITEALNNVLPDFLDVYKEFFQIRMKDYSSDILKDALAGTGYKNNFSDFVKTYSNEEFDTTNPLGLSSSTLDSIFDTSASDRFLTSIINIKNNLEEISTLIKAEDFSKVFNVKIDDDSISKFIESINQLSSVVSTLPDKFKEVESSARNVDETLSASSLKTEKNNSAFDDKTEKIKQEDNAVKSASTSEVQNLDNIRKAVQDITEAVSLKIKAFEEEDDTVKTVSTSEVNSLHEIKQAVDEITQSVNNKTKSFSEADLRDAYNNYKKFVDNNDADSEAGQKAALVYYEAYKSALYAKFSKSDLDKKYTRNLGLNTDDLFTGDYRKWKSGTENLDLSGLNQKIEDTRKSLAALTNPDFSQGIKDISDALNNLITSGTNPDNITNFLKQLNKLISTLGKDKGSDKIDKLETNLTRVNSALEKISRTQSSPILDQITQILQNNRQISALANVLNKLQNGKDSGSSKSFLGIANDFSKLEGQFNKAFKGNKVSTNNIIADLNELVVKWEAAQQALSAGLISQSELDALEEYFGAFKDDLRQVANTELFSKADKKNASAEIVQDIENVEQSLNGLMTVIDKIQNGGTLNTNDLNVIKNLTSGVSKVNSELSNTPKQMAKIGSTQKLLQKIAKALNDNSAASSELKNRLKAVSTELESMGANVPVDEFNRLSNEALTIFKEIQQAGRTGKNLFGKIKDSFTSQFTSMVAQYFSFYDIIRYGREAYEEITKLDTVLVDLRKTTTMTDSELNQFYKDANRIGKEMGVTTEEIINQAAAWSRLGYSSREAASTMAKLSSQFASISPGMSVDDATTGLVSTVKAFGIETDDVLDGVMSKINAVGNNFATSNAEIVQGLQNSASSIAAIGGSLEDAVSLFTGAQEVVQDASKVGKRFANLYSNILTIKVAISVKGWGHQRPRKD